MLKLSYRQGHRHSGNISENGVVVRTLLSRRPLIQLLDTSNTTHAKVSARYRPEVGACGSECGHSGRGSGRGAGYERVSKRV
jgi:hypothetical protein